MKITLAMASLAALTTTLAAVSFFGVLGSTAYIYLYLIAAAVCLAFVVWSLLPRNREASQAPAFGLAQAGCAGLLSLGPLRFSETVNGIVIVLIALVLVESAFRMWRRELAP